MDYILFCSQLIVTFLNEHDKLNNKNQVKGWGVLWEILEL